MTQKSMPFQHHGRTLPSGPPELFIRQTKNRSLTRGGFLFVRKNFENVSEPELGAGYAGRGWTLRTFSDFKGDSVAYLELIKSHADEILGVEKKILCFAIASNESKSPVRQGFDSSGHSDIVW